MALQPWEFEIVRSAPRPVLQLVQPPPRRRPAAALLFVLAVIAAVASPVIVAVVEGPPPPLNWSFRPLPAAAIGSLDPVAPIRGGNRPRSREPVAGIAFVRCTRLWTARSDGSHARKILEMPGLSSPTFSPDGRTIAFLAGNSIWLVGADGSNVRKVGDIRSGDATVEATATGLTWSPKNELAFALVSPNESIWTGGSAIFVLRLDAGQFDRVGAGAPQPFWLADRLAYARWERHTGPDFALGSGAPNELTNKLSSTKKDLSAAIAPSRLTEPFARAAAVLRVGPAGERELVVSPRRDLRRSRSVRPPRGYRFHSGSGVAVTEDDSAAVVALVDRSGEKDLGVYDLRERRWAVLDYAWEPATSPVPVASGPVGARRALDVTEKLLWGWSNRPTRVALLLGARPDEDLMPDVGLEYTTRHPRRVPGGWSVPATVRGWTNGDLVYRDVTVRVLRRSGRLVAELAATSEMRPIETIDDAIAFLDHVLTVPVVVPGWLPEGTRLQRHPVWAYTFDGGTTGSLNLRVPAGSEPGRQRDRYLQISYGNTYFNLGCGSVGDGEGEPVDVAGETGSLARSGTSRQVIWPVVNNKAPGDFSVYGEVPEETVLSIARSMAVSH